MYQLLDKKEDKKGGKKGKEGKLVVDANQASYFFFLIGLLVHV